MHDDLFDGDPAPGLITHVQFDDETWRRLVLTRRAITVRAGRAAWRRDMRRALPSRLASGRRGRIQATNIRT